MSDKKIKEELPKSKPTPISKVKTKVIIDPLIIKLNALKQNIDVYKNPNKKTEKKQ